MAISNILQQEWNNERLGDIQDALQALLNKMVTDIDGVKAKKVADINMSTEGTDLTVTVTFSDETEASATVDIQDALNAADIAVDIVNNLRTDIPTKALSAAMGMELNRKACVLLEHMHLAADTMLTDSDLELNEQRLFFAPTLNRIYAFDCHAIGSGLVNREVTRDVYPPRFGVVYIDKETSTCWRWDGTNMVLAVHPPYFMIADSTSSSTIENYNPSVITGDVYPRLVWFSALSKLVYLYMDGQTRRYVAFDPDPNRVYVRLGTSPKVVQWSGSAWVDVIDISSKANASEVYSKSAADAKFVEQVPNKGLSTNDYTTADQQKVTSALQGVKVNGSELQKDNNNKVNILVTDGKSAYQSYLDTTTDNPKKTEAQWLASLKGADGNSGVGNADNFESVNNLDGGTTDTQSKVYVLGANQGKVLADMIEDLALEVAQKGGGVTVSHSQGVTNIIIGGGGSSVETTAAPSISVADSGLNKVVTINNDEDDTGATIYYTLDGSEPTVQSEVYSSPITISEAGNTTVKAIAKASGKLASSAVSQSVYIEENDWTDGVRFIRNTNGGTTNATGYSISPFIPVNDSDLIWLWCGILLTDSTSPYAFLIEYDENKGYVGQFFSVLYDWKYPLDSGAKYIRFVTKTEDKQKCFVYKYTNDVAGDATGGFLFKGNKIDAATYGKMCGFTSSDINGNISRASRPSNDIEWYKLDNHKVVTGFFDVSKYSSIDIKHGFGNTNESTSTQIVRFYDSSYQSASGKYYTVNTNRPDPRVGMSLEPLEGYANARFQINGLMLHSCYAIGHWADENNVEHEEYIWKGCDVVTEEEEENVE